MSQSSTQQRRNNFDLLRLLFAFIVVLVHMAALSDTPSLSFLKIYFSSSLAVKGFFVISGFLVTMSFHRSSNLRTYLVKRARRVVPAYVLVVSVVALAGILLTSLSPIDYLASTRTWGYFAANLSFLNFLQPWLPGVFTDPQVNSERAVNGALWSIRTEMLCYLVVPLLCVISRIIRPVILYSLVYLLCFGLGIWLLHQRVQTGDIRWLQLKVAFPDQFACFVIGALAFHYSKIFARFAWWLVIPAIVIFGIDELLPGASVVTQWFTPIALAILVLWAGMSLPHLGNFARFGDFSYGVYIYHFPIIQSLIWFGLFKEQAALASVLAIALTFLAAFASWHLVEKRFLRRDSHYIQASTGQDSNAKESDEANRVS